MNKADLKLDWCSHEAAKYACEKWHYSGTMPCGKVVKVGVWERQIFIGVVTFSRGANRNAASPYGLLQTDMCELTRVALAKHESPVSRIVSIAIAILKKQSPGVRLIISYADPEQGHNGGIYQAGGWLCTGKQDSPQACALVNGRQVHKKSVAGKNGSMRGVKRTGVKSKWKYLLPLDSEMKARIEPLRKPYPKRERSADNGTTGHQPVGGGVNPTRSLQNTDAK